MFVLFCFTKCCLKGTAFSVGEVSFWRHPAAIASNATEVTQIQGPNLGPQSHHPPPPIAPCFLGRGYHQGQQCRQPYCSQWLSVLCLGGVDTELTNGLPTLTSLFSWHVACCNARKTWHFDAG